MRKFIHFNFEIDLSNYKITDTAENSWLTGNYFAKYSYPFTIELTDELDQALGFISNHNSLDVQTLFDGLYVHGNIMEKAVLEIEENELGLSATLRYGFDEFPNFTKKLAELPLLQLQVDNIYTHANAVVQQTWPTVNYNFPQIHTDKINPDDDEVWFAFEKIINNRRNGAFLVNEVDITEEITYNRNIIQPLPYLLYLLKAGIEAAGYTLNGDVLQDIDLQKTLVFTDAEYYTSVAQESIPIYVPATEYNTLDATGTHMTMRKEFDIVQPGKYRITGTARLRRLPGTANQVDMVSIYILYRGQTVFSHEGRTAVQYVDFNIDVTFETLSDLQRNFVVVGGDMGYNADDITFDLYVNPIRLNDDNGEAIPSILNLNQVDLVKAVPDMAFGDLVKLVLAMKNMNLSIIEREVWINFVANEIVTAPVIDLSELEVKRPKISYNKGNSFLFKYEDVDSKDYVYVPVFQNKDGYTTTGYTTDDKTVDVPLKALPLPLLTRNSVQTAYSFFQDNSKPLFVMYDGLYGGKNVSRDPANLLVPYLHLNYYAAWWAKRIDTRSYTWSFLTDYEKMVELTTKSRVHAYVNMHLVRSIQKTEVRPDLFEVEIVTELIK